MFICNLFNFPLISIRNIVSINELTLILKMIGQCDVKHDKIKNISFESLRLTVILVIMSILIFITAEIPGFIQGLYVGVYFV
jgi:hypothetical protein